MVKSVRCELSSASWPSTKLRYASVELVGADDDVDDVVEVDADDDPPP